MKFQSSSFRPKKSLGQHFLADSNVIRKILESCELSAEDDVLEIGPGEGAITNMIAPKVRNLTAVEKDRELAAKLAADFINAGNINIIHDDILEYPFETIAPKTKLIGNLPYNISTPVIEKILNYKESFSSIYIMLQLEYGQRLIAKPHTKDYSSFTLFVNYHADVKMLFKINRTCFNPPPKVQSCFLKLTPKNPSIHLTHEKLLFNIIRAAFQQRRKIIENSLSSLCSKERIHPLLKSLNIDHRSRAENLLLEDYKRIAEKLTQEKIEN